MAVYIVHFDKPFKHARHYVGATNDKERRFKEHFNLRKNGNGLIKAVIRAGIEVTVSRVWEGKQFDFEKKLKKAKNTARFCPICQAEKKKNKGCKHDL